MQGQDAPPAVLKSPRPKDRSAPGGIDLESTALRKRDRDSQFGPTTPGADEVGTDSPTEGPGVASHAAKKGRIISRNTSGPSGAAFAPRPDQQDPDLTPPGTPYISSIPASPSASHRKVPSALPSYQQSAGTSAETAGNSKETPPQTPAHHANGDLATASASNKPETSKVKEMREKVQDMSTDEVKVGSGEARAPSLNSAAPSPPAYSTVEEISDLPASAADAESNIEFHHQQGDVIISEPEAAAGKPSTADSSSKSVSDLPAPAPITHSAVANIQYAPRFMPPPSPASSVLAETGSNAGDSDYMDSRPSGSRMSSISSLRNISSANSSSSHLHLHSALPRSSTSSGFDTASDALSDISTEANPPETPRPLADVETPSAGTPNTSCTRDSSLAANPAAPDSPAAPVLNAASISNAKSTPLVQANFGRPTSSFSPGPTSSTPTSGGSKAFVNPFASFGSANSSPFASSSTGATGRAPSTVPGTSSNLSTAAPVTSGFGTSSSASPFAGATGKSAFESTVKSSSISEAKEDTSPDDESDKNEARFNSPSEVQMVTGEEDEFTQYQIPRAKLFVLEGSDFKERGLGQLRLNTRSGSSHDKFSARMVMRSEAVHRLILNVALFSEMNVTLMQDKFLRFSAFEEGKLQHFTIRCSNSIIGKELYDSINDLKSMLPKSLDKDGKKIDEATEEV